MLQPLQEPLVDLRQFLDAVDGQTVFQCLCDGEDAEVGGMGQLVFYVVEARMVVAHEAMHALTDHAQTLLDHLLKAAADAHNLADGLHA